MAPSPLPALLLALLAGAALCGAEECSGSPSQCAPPEEEELSMLLQQPSLLQGREGPPEHNGTEYNETPCPPLVPCPSPPPCPQPCPPPPCPLPPWPTPAPPPANNEEPEGPICKLQPMRIFVKDSDHFARCLSTDGTEVFLLQCGVGPEAAKDQLWLFNRTSSQIVFYGNQSRCLTVDTEATEDQQVAPGAALVVAPCEAACSVAEDPTRQGWFVDTPFLSGTKGKRNVLSSARGIPSKHVGEDDTMDSSRNTMCLTAVDRDVNNSAIDVEPCAADNLGQAWRYMPLKKTCKNSEEGCTSTLKCGCDCMWTALGCKKDTCGYAEKHHNTSCCTNCCCRTEWAKQEKCVHRQLRCEAKE